MNASVIEQLLGLSEGRRIKAVLVFSSSILPELHSVQLKHFSHMWTLQALLVSNGSEEYKCWLYSVLQTEALKCVAQASKNRSLDDFKEVNNHNKENGLNIFGLD